jgi:hypothetical protein
MPYNATGRLPGVKATGCEAPFSKQAEVSGPASRRQQPAIRSRLFARKHDVRREQPRELIRRIGNDRVKLNAAAANFSGSEVDRNCGALGGNRNSRAPNESYCWLPAWPQGPPEARGPGFSVSPRVGRGRSHIVPENKPHGQNEMRTKRPAGVNGAPVG